LIVNDCLEEYFRGLKASENTLRRRRRIRCMGWAQAVTDDFKREQGLGFILAVINDYQEVLFLDISGSTQLKAGSAKALGHHEHVPGDKTSRQRGYEVLWSSWTPFRNAIQAAVSYRIGGSLLSVRLNLKLTQVRHLLTKNYLHI